MIGPDKIDAGNSSTFGDPTQTASQGQADGEHKLGKLIAEWSAMTFEDSQIPSLTEKVRSNDLEDRYYGLIGLRKVIQGEEAPLQPVIDTDIVPMLVEILNETSSTNKMKVEAAWCLTNLCSGSTEQTRHVIENGVIPAFLASLKTSDADVAEQSVWGLANIAGDNAEFRDIILEYNGIEEIVNVLKVVSNENLRCNVAWALSNICRAKPRPDFSVVSGAIPQFCDFLKNESDQQVIKDVAWALSYITADERGVESVVAQNLIPNLIQHLSNPDVAVSIPCLRIIGNIIAGTEEQTSAVLKEKNLLPEMFKLSDHPHLPLRREAFWSVSSITVGTPIQAENVMGNPAYVAKILHVAENDEYEVANEAMWALFNSTKNCTPAQIIRILNNGVFAFFADRVSEEDEQQLKIVLEGIENCLKWGKQFNLVDENGINKFAVFLQKKEGWTDEIKALIYHSNHDISEIALRIANEFFLLTLKA